MNSRECHNPFLRTLEGSKHDLRRFGVRTLGLFGSCLRGEENGNSDVDLLVHFEPGRKTLQNLVDLGAFLEELFHRPVELVTRESLSSRVGRNILNEVQYAQI